MGELRPVHRSVPLGGLLPRGMTRTRLTEEQSYFLDLFALSLFTDCVNAGRTFQEAITAVYLSGMENGISAALCSMGDAQAGGEGEETKNG